MAPLRKNRPPKRGKTRNETGVDFGCLFAGRRDNLWPHIFIRLSPRPADDGNRSLVRRSRPCHMSDRLGAMDLFPRVVLTGARSFFGRYSRLARGGPGATGWRRMTAGRRVFAGALVAASIGSPRP